VTSGAGRREAKKGYTPSELDLCRPFGRSWQLPYGPARHVLDALERHRAPVRHAERGDLPRLDCHVRARVTCRMAEFPSWSSPSSRDTGRRSAMTPMPATITDAIFVAFLKCRYKAYL